MFFRVASDFSALEAPALVTMRVAGDYCATKLGTLQSSDQTRSRTPLHPQSCAAQVGVGEVPRNSRAGNRKVRCLIYYRSTMCRLFGMKKNRAGLGPGPLGW
jgi:hypothetical protein